MPQCTATRTLDPARLLNQGLIHAAPTRNRDYDRGSQTMSPMTLMPVVESVRTCVSGYHCCCPTVAASWTHTPGNMKMPLQAAETESLDHAAVCYVTQVCTGLRPQVTNCSYPDNRTSVLRYLLLAVTPPPLHPLLDSFCSWLRSLKKA